MVHTNNISKRACAMVICLVRCLTSAVYLVNHPASAWRATTTPVWVRSPGAIGAPISGSIAPLLPTEIVVSLVALVSPACTLLSPIFEAGGVDGTTLVERTDEWFSTGCIWAKNVRGSCSTNAMPGAVCCSRSAEIHDEGTIIKLDDVRSPDIRGIPVLMKSISIESC